VSEVRGRVNAWSLRRQGLVLDYFGFTSNHSKTPRLIELNQFSTQSVNFTLHFHVMCLVEFAAERVHSHFKQNADRITDAGESCAKDLLLTFTVDIVIAIAVAHLLPKLWT
jgi:hypothetical protein